MAQAERIDSVLLFLPRIRRRRSSTINFIVTADHGMAELAERYLNLYGVLDSAQVVRTVPGTLRHRGPQRVRPRSARTLATGHVKAWERERCPGATTASIRRA